MTQIETMYPDTQDCTCKVCKNYCRRPCWPTPNEAKKLIEAGYAKRLMRDWWVGNFNGGGGDVYIICPASPGYSGCASPERPVNGCVFFNAKGLCDLHHAGLKPKEGRAVHHIKENKRAVMTLHEAVARTWDTDDGRLVVGLWDREESK